MALILHLSDIHLGPATKDSVFDDYKSEIVPLSERTTRHTLLRNTLRELGQTLLREGKTLDAIVVTGDITVANHEAGFASFTGLLSQLGEVCPPPQKVVVTPGNHDVTWKTPPSSEERYTNFLRHVRSKGYITPILDGVDITEGVNTQDLTQHYLLSPNSDWLIFPINSSNYCGSVEPLTQISDADWEKIPVLLNEAEQGTIRAQLEKFRLHDVARISHAQLTALRNLLLNIDLKVATAGSDPAHTIRIAILHHHLSPVSTSEEFKSFESITNLGLLRAFLRANGIHIVLHGHKHAGHIYWDYINDYSSQAIGAGHHVLVISGSTIGGNDYRDDEVCRLIDIRPREHTPTLSVARIPSVPPGTRLTLPNFRIFNLWHQDSELVKSDAHMKVIVGDTFSKVYARVLSLFEGKRPYDEVENISCTITDATTALTLPAAYPDIPGVKKEARQDWLDDLVSWWQRKETILSHKLHFTHGSRIFAYEGNIDQFERVVSMLKDKANSGRAVIVLINPIIDRISDKHQKFPAFTLAQFFVHRNDNGSLSLDCIGYFRKQEIKYWWTVNVVELAKLQREIFRRIEDVHRGINLGSITTVAAIAFAGTAPPKVVVPAIDRAFDQDQDALWSMTYAIFSTSLKERETLLEYWDHFLNDLIPAETPDPDGVPVAVDGIKFVLDLTRRFAKHQPTSPAELLIDELQRLYNLNAKYAEDTLIEEPDRARHDSWREAVIASVRKIKAALTELRATS
jgi:3',5'-cyclic AMP phosphodiesterase CpdA